MSTKDRAVELGRIAFLEGKDITDNPYKNFSNYNIAAMWDMGYLHEKAKQCGDGSVVDIL